MNRSYFGISEEELGQRLLGLEMFEAGDSPGDVADMLLDELAGVALLIQTTQVDVEDEIRDALRLIQRHSVRIRKLIQTERALREATPCPKCLVKDLTQEKS